jgi:ribonuclease P protein component
VLPKANRVARADDFRMTVRRGRRVTTPHALLYIAARNADDPTRFGFIVSKAVGNAVVRNLVTRRLRSIGRGVLEFRATGSDIVIRALPGSPEAPWTTLQGEIFDGLERGAGKR